MEMKKLFLLVFCFLALGISGQQKKTTKPKTKSTTSLKKVNPTNKSASQMCGLCSGTGKCYVCKGSLVRYCTNHNGKIQRDDYCLENCDSEESCDDCKPDKEIYCTTCRRVNSSWECDFSYCDNGKCKVCNGTGKRTK